MHRSKDELRSSVSMMQGDVGKLGTKVTTTENTLKNLGCQVRSLNEKLFDMEKTVEREGGRRGRSSTMEDKVRNLGERISTLEQRMCKQEKAKEHSEAHWNCTEGGETNHKEGARALEERLLGIDGMLEQHGEQQENNWKGTEVAEQWAVSEPLPDIQPTNFESYVSVATLQAHLQEVYNHVDQRLSMVVDEIHSKVDRILQLQQTQHRHNWSSRNSSRDRWSDGPETPSSVHRTPDFAYSDSPSNEVVLPGLPMICKPEVGRRAMSDQPEMLLPAEPASTAPDISLRGLCLAKSGIYHLQGPPQEPQSQMITSRI